jgi:hypothetical protein
VYGMQHPLDANGTRTHFHSGGEDGADLREADTAKPS